jgi:hypothetical protein
MGKIQDRKTLVLSLFLLSTVLFLSIYKYSGLFSSVIPKGRSNTNSFSDFSPLKPVSPKSVVTTVKELDISGSKQLDLVFSSTRDLNPPSKLTGNIGWGVLTVFKPSLNLLAYKNSYRDIALIKYDNHKSPYSGYGLAVTRIGRSFYPEVYFKGSKGGGWYLFPPIDLYGEWLAFLILRVNNHLLLYNSALDKSFNMLNGKYNYLGAYLIKEVGSLNSIGHLTLRSDINTDFNRRFFMTAVFSAENIVTGASDVFNNITSISSLASSEHLDNFKLSFISDMAKTK